MYWYIDLLRYKNRSSRITNSSSPFCWSESANCKTFRESPFVHSFLPAGRRVERQASSSGLVCPFLLRFQKPLCVFKNEFSYPARIKTNAFPVISSSVSFRCWPLRPPAASIISCRESTGFSPDKGGKCTKPIFFLRKVLYLPVAWSILRLSFKISAHHEIMVSLVSLRPPRYNQAMMSSRLGKKEPITAVKSI